MSLSVDYLISDAALKIGDVNRTRVRDVEWVLFYNQAVRELCEKANVLEFQGLFDTLPTDRYGYPWRATAITKFEAQAIAGDANTFFKLDELREDEFTARTDRLYPPMDPPLEYFPRRNWFHLVGKPTTTVVQGGRLTYFGIPDRIFDLPSAIFPLPEFCQDYVIRRLVIAAKYARDRIGEADAELKQWIVDVAEGLQDKMEDRVDDRRPAIRPTRAPMAGMR